MSSLTLSLRVVFDDIANASLLASYLAWQPRGAEWFTKRGWPGREAWFNESWSRKQCFFLIMGDLPPGTEVTELVAPLLRTTSLVVVYAFHDQVGEYEKCWLVDGKPVSPLQAVKRARKLKLDPEHVMRIGLYSDDVKALKNVLADADPNAEVQGEPLVCRVDDAEAVLALLEAGANPSKKSRQALLLNTWSADPRIVKRLLSLGVDPNAKYGYSSETPLSCALASKPTPQTLQAVALLLSAGAKPNAGSPLPLYSVAERLRSPSPQRKLDIKLLELLLDHGASPTRKLGERGNLIAYAERATVLRPALRRRGWLAPA